MRVELGYSYRVLKGGGSKGGRGYATQGSLTLPEAP